MKAYNIPLEADTRYKNLVYVSTAKLKQMHLNSTKRGFNASGNFGPLGAGMGLPSHEKSIRELLNDAAEHYERHNILRYEVTPERGDHLLVRVHAIGGSAWPWAGDKAELHRTMWLVGRSENLRILAYGNRKHLSGIGDVPSDNDVGGVATWWPSAPGGHEELLMAAAKVINRDDIEAELDIPCTDSETPLGELTDYFFNSGVQRGDPLLPKGVYEMLLRVDGVEKQGKNTPVVYGSPLWVARETRAVPGTYWIMDFPEEPGVTAVASWDGRIWSNMRFQDNRNNQMRNLPLQVDLPQLPTNPPADSRMLSSLSITNEDLDGCSPVSDSSSKTKNWFTQLTQRIKRWITAG